MAKHPTEMGREEFIAWKTKQLQRRGWSEARIKNYFEHSNRFVINHEQHTKQVNQ